MADKIPTGEQDYRRRIAIEVWQRQHARREYKDPVKWSYPGEHHKCEDRAHGWVWAAVVIICTLLAAGLSKRAEAQAVGVNLVTAHSTAGYRVWTPGAYVRTEGGVTAGVLRNSEGGTSVHLSRTWRAEVVGLPLDLQAGAITGYRRAPVVPLATASILLADHHRLVLIPGPRCVALHYALEFGR